ncbi:12216_t:CDS:2 [Entrophospora sp. SA101]|nr:12216_t:CDS:2 [Entrophospora sp. SA101]CAJ0860831.1 12716_t:CDS:2 [Entrophospora sp. SA101]CAJ0860874.1 12720_t:CDS:2 [Entrophospora sp. SA101]
MGGLPLMNLNGNMYQKFMDLKRKDFLMKMFQDTKLKYKFGFMVTFINEHESEDPAFILKI